VSPSFYSYFLRYLFAECGSIYKNRDNFGNSLDAATTSAAANAYKQVGYTVSSTLESVGSSIPKL
jgi:hypothetical protein